MTKLFDTFPGGTRQSPQGYAYFLPGSIYQSSELTFPARLFRQMEKTSIALGQFSSLIDRVPNTKMFIHSYLRKEATLSSRIEGTQTEIEEAFMTQEDIASEKRDDWAEINAYTNALESAIEGLKGLPLCNRLLKQTHERLLSQARGRDKLPGEFRRSQNWIGGSRPDNAHYVPPSYEYVSEAMSDLERFIQDDQTDLPHLVKAALIHCQFETIHPFLDGNGRLGRMLISLYLLEKKVLQHPILYISSFFERHRSAYYEALDKTRENSDGVISWIAFFLEGVYETASAGIKLTNQIIDYRADLIEKQIPQLGKRAPRALKLLDFLFEKLVINAKLVQTELGFSPQVTQTLLKHFMELGILGEITRQKRNRVFVLKDYLDLLKAGDI